MAGLDKLMFGVGIESLQKEILEKEKMLNAWLRKSRSIKITDIDISGVKAKLDSLQGTINSVGSGGSAGLKSYQEQIAQLSERIEKLARAIERLNDKQIGSGRRGRKRQMEEEASAAQQYANALEGLVKAEQRAISMGGSAAGKGLFGVAGGMTELTKVGEKNIQTLIAERGRIERMIALAQKSITFGEGHGQERLAASQRENLQYLTNLRDAITHILSNRQQWSSFLNTPNSLKLPLPGSGNDIALLGGHWENLKASVTGTSRAIREAAKDMTIFDNNQRTFATNSESLKTAMYNVEGALKRIQESYGKITSPSDAVSQSYNAQVDALKAQLETLRNVSDATKRTPGGLTSILGADHKKMISDAHQSARDFDQIVRQERQSTEALSANMRNAAKEGGKLEETLRIMRNGTTRKEAETLKIDTTAYDKALRKVEQYQRVLDAVSASGRFDSSKLAIGAQAANRELKTQEDALRRLIVEAQKAAQSQSQLTSEEQRLASSIRQTSQGLINQSQIMSDLKSMATQYLGVWGGQQFLHNIIEIGGQLEMQRLSIGAILGDVAQANTLFGQIKGLAVQSPFGVVQLDQMTKQLSAYGFKYNELFDMTKRLADISAATGTDVSRLALALGHVRSEAALSGYTLRQFSMANIPLAEKLAEKLGVTVKQIRKMTSKKEIGYEDVLSVIKDLTNPEGMFYNAQEVMSQSVKARFKNLKDAMDIMYGEMAESDLIGGPLKEVAAILTDLTRQWQVLMPVILASAAAFGAQRLAIMALNSRAVAFSGNIGVLAKNTSKLTAMEVENLMVSGQVTRQQLLTAVATKRLTVNQAELAAATKGISRAQLEQVASSGKIDAALLGNAISTSKYTMTQLRLLATMRAGNTGFFAKGLMGVRLALLGARDAAVKFGLALKSIGKSVAWMAALDLIIGVWAKVRQQSEMAEESARRAFETGSEGVRNLKQSLKSLPQDIEGVSDNDLRSRIKSAAEELSQYSTNYSAIVRNINKGEIDGKPIKSLADRYSYLRRELLLAERGLEEFQRTSEAQKFAIDQTGGIWGTDKVYEDIVDYYKAQKNFYDETDRYASKHYEAVRKGIEAAQRQDEAYRKATVGIDSYAEKLRILVKDINKYNTAYHEFNKHGNAVNLAVLWNSSGIISTSVERQRAEAEAEIKKWADGLKAKLKGTFGYNFSRLSKVQFDNIKRHITAFVESEELGRLDDKTKEWARKFAGRQFGITFDAKTDEAIKDVDALEEELIRLTSKDFVINLKINEGTAADIIGNARKERKSAKSDLATIEKSIRDSGYLGKFIENVEQRGDTSMDMARSEADRKLLKSWLQERTKKKNSESLLDAFHAEYTDPSNSRSGSGGHKTDEQLKRWREQISLLDKYRQKVEEFSKIMTEAQAREELRANGNFASLFTAFTNPDDYVASLDEMIKRLGTKGDRGEFAKQLGTKKEDENLRKRKEDTESLVNELSRMLDIMRENYDVYKEWLKLTGDANLAAQVAGVTANTSYADLLKDEYKKAGGADGLSAEDFFGLKEGDAKKFGKSSRLFKLWEEWQNNSKKISKEDVDRYKRAVEAAKGYEEKVADIKRRLQEEKDSIERLTAIKDDDDEATRRRKTADRSRLTDNATKNAQQDIAKETWEQFKKDEDWGRIFADLDSMSTQTLRHMLERLREVAPTINASVEATKALYEAMEKIDNVLGERNPLKMIGDAISRGSALRSFLSGIKGSADNDEIYVSSDTAKKTGLKQGKQKAGTARREAEDGLKDSESDLDKGLKGLVKKFADMQDALTPVIDLFDQLGMTDISSLFSMGSNALGAAAQMGQGAEALISGAGPYGAAIGAGLSVVTSLFAMHDKALQEEIEASQARQKEMENLSKNLESALGNALGGVYYFAENIRSQKYRDRFNEEADKRMDNLKKADEYEARGTRFDKIIARNLRESAGSDETIDYMKRARETQEYYDMERASLSAQRDELERQMQAEQDKKDSDDNAIADYRQQLNEIEDDLANFALDMANTLYDIDLKSWASELTDAVVEAWDNGEDAAEAYTDKVKDLMKDLSKNILAQKVIEKAFENAGIDKLIEDMMNANSGKLDYTAVGKLSDALMSAGNNATDTIYAVLDDMEKKGYINKGDGSSTTSSKVIQGGFNENETGLVLSYLNAIRADLSVQRGEVTTISQTYLPTLMTLMTSGNTSLRNIENHTEAIMRSNDDISKNMADLRDDIHGLKNGAWRVPMA